MSDASRKIICPSCHREYGWQEKFAGKKVRCKCGQAISVPALAEDDNTIPLAMDDDALSLHKTPSPRSAKAQAPEPAASTAVTNEGYCPSCKHAVKPTAVICLQCGYNFKEHTQLSTATGGMVRATTGPVNGPRHSYVSSGQSGFFDRMSTGWQLIKMSYGIIWDFKMLTIFPVLSGICAIIVSASYLLPVFMYRVTTGDAGGGEELSPEAQQMENIINMALGLGFYFVNYFVIVFFNTALTACTMKVTAGEAPTVGYGFSIAIKRLPQIAAWALVSAVVGQLIKFLESQKVIGKIMAVVLGTGWAVITYFVVPVLCVEGVGPFKAIKRSFGTIRETWGEQLVGNVAMGAVNFLLALPLILVIVIGVVMMMGEMVTLGLILAGAGMVGLVLFAVFSSAADGVFKALLYNYATGRSLPADVDEDLFAAAFASKGYDS